MTANTKDTTRASEKISLEQVADRKAWVIWDEWESGEPIGLLHILTSQVAGGPGAWEVIVFGDAGNKSAVFHPRNKSKPTMGELRMAWRSALNH